MNNFMFFIKFNNLLSKIGPIWAHKGPMGPNPDRAPTRTGPSGLMLTTRTEAEDEHT